WSTDWPVLPAPPPGRWSTHWPVLAAVALVDLGPRSRPPWGTGSPFPAGFWSLARSGAATSQGAPAPVPAASFLPPRRSLPAGDHVPPLLVNVLAPSLRLAGFQVSITGRFWVSTEGMGASPRRGDRRRPAPAPCRRTGRCLAG